MPNAACQAVGLSPRSRCDLAGRSCHQLFGSGISESKAAEKDHFLSEILRGKELFREGATSVT